MPPGESLVELRPRRVMVTGGAGFIGSHLTRRLLELGHVVLVVDNFYSGTRQNIEELKGQTRFELMRHDVTFPHYVEVDEIYHLACPASPVFYQRDPVQTTKTCVPAERFSDVLASADVVIALLEPDAAQFSAERGP